MPASYFQTFRFTVTVRIQLAPSVVLDFEWETEVENEIIPDNFAITSLHSSPAFNTVKELAFGMQQLTEKKKIKKLLKA